MNLSNATVAVCALALISGQSLAAPGLTDAPVASLLQNAGEFSGCKWERVAGARFSISSFACDTEHGGVRLVADNAAPGFWLMERDGSKRPAIRLFSKAVKAPISTILPAVRAASVGPQTRTCVLTYSPSDSAAQPGTKRYVLQPHGVALKAWEKAQDQGKAVDEPCGPLGVAMVGDRYFEVMPGHPGIVVFANMGSEIQIFDPTTLRTVNGP